MASDGGGGRPLAKHVQEEFEAYLKCGRFEHGFLRGRCERCHAEKLVAFSCCPQLETIKSPAARVRCSRDSSRSPLPIVSHPQARR